MRVQVDGSVSERAARLVGAEEKQRLWPRFREVWPAYDDYHERSGRGIRIFALEPVELW